MLDVQNCPYAAWRPCEAGHADCASSRPGAQRRGVTLFSARRADIESFARDLEAKGQARSAVSRRLATIAGLNKYAVEEDLLDHSPAAHVRRPRLITSLMPIGPGRNEAGAILVTAGLGSPAERALVSLLALNGLRVSEAAGADIEDLTVQRGHRILAITHTGREESVVPLAPRTARAAGLAAGDGCEGPIFPRLTGRPATTMRYDRARITRPAATYTAAACIPGAAR